jgi:hypothetical protein
MIWLKEPVESSCEHSNEPSRSVKFWEVSEYLYNCQIYKHDSAP